MGVLEFLGFPKLKNNKPINCKEAISDDQNFDANPIQEFLDPDCNLNNTLLPESKRNDFLNLYGKYCLNQPSCSIPINLFFGLYNENLKEQCRNEYLRRIKYSAFRQTLNFDGSIIFGPEKDDSVPEPIVIARASCKSSLVKIPFSEEMVSKDQLGSMVVLIDIVAVISMLLFVCILDMRQEEFINAFKESTIQMDDYSLKIKNFPNDEEFLNEEYLLKA